MVDFVLTLYTTVIILTEWPVVRDHVWGLDGLLEQLHMVDHYQALRPLVESSRACLDRRVCRLRGDAVGNLAPIAATQHHRHINIHT